MTDQERIEEIHQWKKNGFTPRWDNMDWALQQITNRDERIKELVDGLEEYAQRDNWHEFILQGGNLFPGSCDGDICMAYSQGEDKPWENAKRLIEEKGGG